MPCDATFMILEVMKNKNMRYAKSYGTGCWEYARIEERMRCMSHVSCERELMIKRACELREANHIGPVRGNS